MVQGGSGCPLHFSGVLVRLIRHQGDGLDPLAARLPANAPRGERPVVRLPAGHGHRIVVQHLEGDVDAGGHRGANGQGTGVEVGAVAHLLEDMLGGGEGRLAQPAGAFAAHLGEAVHIAVHKLG